MNKIFLIIRREYLSRVQKRSFIIMTILGPVIFAAFILIPTWMATMQDTNMKNVAVYDSAQVLLKHLPDDKFLKFEYPSGTSMATLKKELAAGQYYAVLEIDTSLMNSGRVSLFSNKQPSMGTNMYISGVVKNIVQDQKFEANHISLAVINSIHTDIQLTNIKLTEEGKEEKSNADIKMWVAYASGLLIYFFIFMFGVQVMRGVIEEKTNRIVEVIISSVRPFQLMMGKIVGIAFVGLTQFVLWVILTTVIYQAGAQLVGAHPAAANTAISSGMVQNMPQQAGNSTPKIQEPQKDAASSIFDQINLPLILCCFVFYFIGGYLLYGSMFAAVGSAVDNDTDTQQFMMPITIPLILGIFVMINTMTNPESTLSFWFSIIPFTSPIVMMARVAYGVPPAELVLSMALLVATFIGMTWLASRVYKVGILMYGKKVNYKELWKWIRYLN